MEKMTRAEHLEWCKKRALEYVDAGDINQAYASMGSDLRKHEETANHPALEVGIMMLVTGRIKTPGEMRKFINGFH